MNDIFAIIGIFAVGFAAGMYVSTQISKCIDRNIK